MKNKDYTINTDPVAASYIIGNYNMYVSDVYNALETLQSYLEDSKFKNLVESDSQEIQEMLEESCVIPDFSVFLEQLKDAMGY